MYQKYIKRWIDLIMSLFGLLVFSPIFLVIAISIKISSPGPVFFVQKRVGKNDKPFYILKFRTMRIDTPKNCPTHMLEDPAKYITSVGKFLRKTSLDELPQIINILKGEMAIIGPRPALWNQYDLIQLRDRNGSSKLRPGLTGLAQISGRDELEIEFKAQLDGVYSENISFKKDMALFIRTFISVIRSDGVKEGKSK